MKKLLLFFGLLVSTVAFSQTWQAQFLGYPNDLESVNFPTSEIGYIFGEEIMYKTTNGGTNWNKTDVPYTFLGSDFLNANYGFGFARIRNQMDSHVVLKTTNGGLSYSVYHLGFLYQEYDERPVKIINENIAYIFSGTRFYKTTNAGLSWVSSSYASYHNWFALENSIFGSRADPPNNMFAKSTNLGLNWSTHHVFGSIGLYSGQIFMINVSTGYCYFTGELFKTNSGGSSWSEVNSGGNHGLIFLNENTGYAYGYLNNPPRTGISKTTNGGINWPFVEVHEIVKDITFINSLTGFCACENGVLLKTTNGGTPIGITNVSQEIPKEFSLKQNYPNPFNPTTNIEFSLPKESFVTLSIVDVTGKEILRLVNEELSEGVYKVDFNGSTYPSGIYFYKLKAGNYTDTRRMILLK